ncbi:MAG: RpiR family transcriptional regulator, partial [Rhodobacteraceae bacterium]|nr:RpiR family transcriptional regulator [Paracoccaceae bacterium]
QVQEFPDALTPSASRFAFLMIIDLIAAATGYHLGDRARENLRRIKFNMVSTVSGENLEPLGE